LEVTILDQGGPCTALADHFFNASLQDAQAIETMGSCADAITVEIENVSLEGLRRLEQRGKKVCPSSSLLAIIQDKGRQKDFFQRHQIPTAPFVLVGDHPRWQDYASLFPAFYKLRQGGYDGRGVLPLAKIPEQLPESFQHPGVLEKKINIAKELAVIVARNANGEMALYPPVEMCFDPQWHQLDYLQSPAKIPGATTQLALDYAAKIANNLQLQGLLAVEMFLTPEGELLVNEMAPRPHNSRHHTIEAFSVSQFEQIIRAVLNWPLGAVEMISPAITWNIIGEEMARIDPKIILASPKTYLHLYGKEARPGRKVGHITLLDEDLSRAYERMRRLRACYQR
jgi:5-(carboxyamino)imidazole ribonucleotide synthase